MAITLNSYLETVDSIGPSSASFSLENGRSVRTWYTESPIAAGDITNAITQILGTTATASSANGKLNRTLPLADPQFFWLYASSISAIKGIGQHAMTASSTEEFNVQSFPNFALYKQYEFTVESTTRPYQVFDDSFVPTVGGSWVNTAGSLESYNYATEWNRYTDGDFIPQNDYLTQQKGRMGLYSSAFTKPKSFAAMPRMFLPNQIFRLRWFQVPLRYLLSTNAYIPRWRGRVNQKTWTHPQLGTFKPGSLLYLNYSPIKKYPPTVPTSSDPQTGGIANDKLCDIEFTFLYTTRTAHDIPGGVPTSGNGNFVTAGHNLQPWMYDQNFYYAETIPNPPAAIGYPTWKSFPMEMLFTDPDSPQPPTWTGN